MTAFLDGHMLEAIAGEDLSRYERVKLNGTTEHGVVGCQAGEPGIGVTRASVASGGNIAVMLFNKAGTFPMLAAGAITRNVLVYPAGDGRVDDAISGQPLGLALTSASAAGDWLEVLMLGAPLVGVGADPLGPLGPGVYGVHDDFLSYVPASSNEAFWTLTATDSGTASLADGAGGVLVLAPSDGTVADNDEVYLHSTNELFLFAAGKSLFFEAKFSYTEANTDDANLIMGFMSAVGANSLQDNGAGPAASYSGVVVYKVDGGTAWLAEASIAGTQTAITLTGAGTPGGGTSVRVSILVVTTSSTSATAYIYFDGTLVGSSAFTYTSATEMMCVFGVKNGSANNESISVDYITAKQVR